MIKTPLEIIADFFGLTPKNKKDLVWTPEKKSLTLPTDSIRFSPEYQNHVYAPKIRAMELVIHLRNKYGNSWKSQLENIHTESSEVTDLLPKIEYYDPEVSFTTDYVPALYDGFHTVCAYRSLGKPSIKVKVLNPHPKSSTELGLLPLDQLLVYPHMM